MKKEDKSLPDNIFESDTGVSDWLSKSLGQYIHKMNGLGNGQLYDLVIRGVEKPLICIALETTKWNQAEASKLLGINRNTLRKKIKSLGIEIKKNGQ